MAKSMTILYEVGNNLYVNLTNRCSAACTFCLRMSKDYVAKEEDVLWLEHEPSYEEVVKAFEKFDMTKYGQLVFCGYGEPTERFDLIKEVAAYAKDHFGISTRINTNGHGDLINGRHIAPEMKGLIDSLSISLNTPNRERYHELVRSQFGPQAYDAMLAFTEEAGHYVPDVKMTTVETTLTAEEEEECRQICQRLGVTYRIRPWED